MSLITRIARSLGRVRRKPFCRRPELEALEDRMVPSTTGLSAIQSRFNIMPIRAGDTIWFSSVGKVNGVGSSPVTLDIVNASIDFTVNGTTYNEVLPNAVVTFSPTAKTATTTFDAASNTWDTTVPSHPDGDVFLDGFALTLPNGLPGGIHPVTFQATFESDTPGLSVKWQWAAAVYSHFSTDYNALNVKPVDSFLLCSSKNFDPPATPEAYKRDVVAGARGHGFFNYTGHYTRSARVIPGSAAPASLAGNVVDLNDNPLSGVLITLTGTDSNGNAVNLTATTQPDGTYCFGSVAVGNNYTLTVTPPDGYMASGATAGTDKGVLDGAAGSSGTQITGIVLNGGDKASGYNFTLSNFVPVV